MHIYFLITVVECIYYLHADCTEIYWAVESDVVMKGSTIVYMLYDIITPNIVTLWRLSFLWKKTLWRLSLFDVCGWCWCCDVCCWEKTTACVVTFVEPTRGKGRGAKRRKREELREKRGESQARSCLPHNKSMTTPFHRWQLQRGWKLH